MEFRISFHYDSRYVDRIFPFLLAVHVYAGVHTVSRHNKMLASAKNVIFRPSLLSVKSFNLEKCLKLD